MPQSIDEYWNGFLSSQPPTSYFFGRTISTERFGHTPQLADELGGLVVSGLKTGSCSALWEWEADGHSLPHPGMVTIVLNGREEPLCIIEITEVYVRRFRAVDEDFAHSDGWSSLLVWRESKREYFSRTLPRIRREFSEDMPLVCVLFKLIHS